MGFLGGFFGFFGWVYIANPGLRRSSPWTSRTASSLAFSSASWRSPAGSQGTRRSSMPSSIWWEHTFSSEMEFLDMNLTPAFCEYRDGILGHEFDKKIRVFCSMLCTVSSYRKPYSAFVLKIHLVSTFSLRWNSWTWMWQKTRESFAPCYSHKTILCSGFKNPSGEHFVWVW